MCSNVKVTIRTIAERSGVSVPTVSRVLNTPELVRAETRAKVMAIVNELNFYPNESARRLRTESPSTIGVIFPQLRDFFFAEIYKGMFDAAAAAGLDILLHDGQMDHARMVEGFRILKRRQCSAIIFASVAITPQVEFAAARTSLPVAYVLTESQREPHAAFMVDEIKAAFDATAHLITRGHREIGMISGPLTNPIAGKQRWDGYQQALRHYGLNYDERLVVFGEFRFEHGYAATEELLRRAAGSRPPTAIFAVSDEMAVGAIRCLFDHGLGVPEDVSVMGFDNIRLADMVTPKLSTVAQPFEEIGAAAVQYLAHGARGDARTLCRTQYLPHTVIARESTRMLPCDTS